jgi:hypothetical protein
MCEQNFELELNGTTKNDTEWMEFYFKKKKGKE